MNILKGAKIAAGAITALVGTVVALKAGKAKEQDYEPTLEELGGETAETTEEGMETIEAEEAEVTEVEETEE